MNLTGWIWSLCRRTGVRLPLDECLDQPIRSTSASRSLDRRHGIWCRPDDGSVSKSDPLPALRVGPRAAHRLQRDVRLADQEIQPYRYEVGVYERARGRGDPRSDDGRGLLPSVRGGRHPQPDDEAHAEDERALQELATASSSAVRKRLSRPRSGGTDSRGSSSSSSATTATRTSA